MYAVIRTGGKQYRVQPGDKVRAEKLAAEVGSKVVIPEVLAIEKDGQIVVGKPTIEKATVEATVVGHDRAKKILVFKKKRKKQFRRTKGHRQDYTELRIEKIEA